MAKVLASIFTDLTTALTTVIGSEFIYLGNRPKLGDKSEPMKKFAVIQLPVSIEDIAVGKKKFALSTTGVFYLFTQSKKDSTLNLTASSDLADDVSGLFPIDGKFCQATNPSVLMKGEDGFGYQVTTITFDLRTKAKVFDNS